MRNRAYLFRNHETNTCEASIVSDVAYEKLWERNAYQWLNWMPWRGLGQCICVGGLSAISSSEARWTYGQGLEGDQKADRVANVLLVQHHLAKKK